MCHAFGSDGELALHLSAFGPEAEPTGGYTIGLAATDSSR
jgi:hypothetical protein